MDIQLKTKALELLQADADKIKNLIKQQTYALCIAQCKAFEEVVDTQMYGFSREVMYAVRIGFLTEDEGQEILSGLERELNMLYTEVADTLDEEGAE
ncbi:Uncharacterized protein YlaN, UPF0358 family [Pilibacter termitis]|uniref:Uncharacterized protein YlaN, UPF0358 family n=1 Tax=Pilibacter termitis TaxID=263852 RepID=A0A1T4NZV4_9ENTE|nr:YlaN family protein [Pilibacter termitis]SJZ84804.1 Uncharacterized protein YlaN, UPF0358 family [Pilibacter termitis]